MREADRESEIEGRETDRDRQRATNRDRQRHRGIYRERQKEIEKH